MRSATTKHTTHRPLLGILQIWSVRREASVSQWSYLGDEHNNKTEQTGKSNRDMRQRAMH